MPIGPVFVRRVRAVRTRPSSQYMRPPARRRWVVRVRAWAIWMLTIALLAEAGFRVFWKPKYWIRCENWLVGSGQTEAGRKWWPNAAYEIESLEFRVRFATNQQGYRARPVATHAPNAFRIVFVGDSFTEGVQVDYDRTFCALIERGLSQAAAGRTVVCENYGVSATGPFEYWHRIKHDVLGPCPPDAVVLCLYPGNDFLEPLPDDGFEPDGRPKDNYFSTPGWPRHFLTWCNLKSKFAYYLIRSTYVAALRWQATASPELPHWWTDPALAAHLSDSPSVRRVRALLQAIAAACRERDVKLCILVVGPAADYAACAGRSPLAHILAGWQIQAPVIDAAMLAAATPHAERLVFERDGHPNEAGHAFIAAAAVPGLRTALGLDEHRRAGPALVSETASKPR